MAEHNTCLRSAVPLVASGCVLTTLITCFTILKVNHRYAGGLTWPFFSDMGRDAPGYYIFCVGLSLTAIFVAWTYILNAQFQRAAMESFKNESFRVVRIISVLALFCGVIACPGLPTLAFFSTTSFPKTHVLGAYWFFAWQVVAVCTNTLVSVRLLKAAKGTSGERSFARTLRVQAAFAIAFFVAFLIYIPIGSAIAEGDRHLSLDECLERNLGDSYCEDTMRFNSTHTELWNYETDFTAVQIRAGGQLGCMLTLVGYSTSFALHRYSALEDSKSVA